MEGHLRFLSHTEKSNDLFNKTIEKHDTIPKAFSTFQSIVVLLLTLLDLSYHTVQAFAADPGNTPKCRICTSGRDIPQTRMAFFNIFSTIFLQLLTIMLRH